MVNSRAPYGGMVLLGVIDPDTSYAGILTFFLMS